MAMLDCESFALSTNMTDWRTSGLLINGSDTTIGTNGPFGDNYWQGLIAGNQAFGDRPLPAPCATPFFFGARFRIDNTGRTSEIQFMDAALTRQFYIAVSAVGTLTINNGAGTVLATLLNAFVQGAWYYVEVGATVATSGGTVEVRSNGVSILTFTGNNQGATTNQVAYIRWGHTGNAAGGTYGIAHYYFNDNTGPAPNNTYLGDVRVAANPITANDAVQFAVGSGGIPPFPGPGTVAAPTITANTIIYLKYTAPASGTLTGVCVQGNGTNYSTGNIRAGIYDATGTAGGPGALLATSASLSAPGASSNAIWNFQFAAGPSLVNGTVYWIALQPDSALCIPQANTTTSNTVVAYTQSVSYASGLPGTATLGGATTSDIWFGVSLPSNYANINRAAPLVGFYNIDSTIGDQDTFATSATPVGLGTVFAVSVKALAYRADPGQRQMAAVLKSSATVLAGGNVTIGSSVLPLRLLTATDPATGIAWTQSGVSAAKPGYTVIS